MAQAKRIMRMMQRGMCVILSLQLAGCGTLLHPERRGQRAGRIDPGIAILDGIGLLFLIIPGLIAFAIDFTTGTIYLPGTTADSFDPATMKVVRFDPTRATAATIEEIIWKETGQRVKLNQANMKIVRLESLEELRTRFAEVGADQRVIRIASR